MSAPETPQAASPDAGKHHEDALSIRKAQSIADRLKSGKWVSRVENVEVSRAHRLTVAALTGAVSRGWTLANDLEHRGDVESADRIREWCRTMRRALPADAAPLPAMPAPEPRRVIIP